jgi:hypothetical protein
MPGAAAVMVPTDAFARLQGVGTLEATDWNVPALASGTIPDAPFGIAVAITLSTRHLQTWRALTAECLQPYRLASFPVSF